MLYPPKTGVISYNPTYNWDPGPTFLQLLGALCWWWWWCTLCLQATRTWWSHHNLPLGAFPLVVGAGNRGSHGRWWCQRRWPRCFTWRSPLLREENTNHMGPPPRMMPFLPTAMLAAGWCWMYMPWFGIPEYLPRFHVCLGVKSHICWALKENAFLKHWVLGSKD